MSDDLTIAESPTHCDPVIGPTRDALAIWDAIEECLYHEAELSAEIQRIRDGTSPYGDHPSNLPDRFQIALNIHLKRVRRLLQLPEDWL